MTRKLKTRVPLLILWGSGLLVGSASAQNSLLSQKPPRAAARTASEHQYLADHYRAEAQECHEKLIKQEALVNYWGRKLWMQSRLKLPNPYSSARTLVDVYRAREEKWSRLAAEQDHIAKLSRKP